MTIILLARQFLSNPEENGISDGHVFSTRDNLTSHQLLNPAVSSFIYWPFLIGFSFKFVIFISFLILSIIPTPHEIQEKLTKSRSQTQHKHSNSDTEKIKIKNYFLVFGLLFSSALLVGACQVGFIQYTFSTAVKLNNGFNQKDAALLNIVILGVSSISLLLTSLAAYYIPIRILTLTLSFCAVLPDTLLTFAGSESHKLFWIFAIFKAFLFTPNGSLIIPYIDSYIEMAGGLVASYEAMYFIGSIIQYFINGYLLEYKKTSWTLLLFGLSLTVSLFMTQFGAFLAAREGCIVESQDQRDEERLIETSEEERLIEKSDEERLVEKSDEERLIETSDEERLIEKSDEERLIETDEERLIEKSDEERLIEKSDEERLIEKSD